MNLNYLISEKKKYSFKLKFLMFFKFYFRFKIINIYHRNFRERNKFFI